ncbi:MAG: peptidoglycan DD-metalloendopeptidase family protein [Patescibacteria group bacterium]
MNTKTNKYIGILMAFALVMAHSAMGFAQSQDFESDETESQEEEIQATREVENKETSQVSKQSLEAGMLNALKVEGQENEVKSQAAQQSSTENSAGTETVEADSQDDKELINQVKKEIDLSKTDYKQLLNNISDTQQHLDHVSEEKMTLQEQLHNLDGQVDYTKEKLIAVVKEMLTKENEIKLLKDEIEKREVALEYQKTLVKDYVKMIYQEEDAYLTFEQDGSVDAFKLLLDDGSVGDNLRKLEYFSLLNEAGQQMMDRLDRIYKELNGYKLDLEEKTKKLGKLKDDLIVEKRQLELQKESKARLLKLTTGQEEIYKDLLQETILQQEQLITDIKSLNSAFEFIKQKMEEEGEDFDFNKYKDLLDKKSRVAIDFQLLDFDADGGEFNWPVPPNRGISAYFRDPNYAGAFGVQHQAIDIPAYQGSTVRSSGDGVVYLAKDNGYGYSYIIIAHNGGFTSVYGHISSILVESGQKVSQGSIIGLSGGMPGTVGAGYMTTGPHLHYEMLLNGTHVDPLQYLPLKTLTEDQVGKLPTKYQDDWTREILEQAAAKLE